MSAGSEPTVTVVIGSNAPPESLAACLEALEPQREGVEVLVQEGRPSPADLRDRFPWADFALAPDQLVPEHWRDGIDRASGEIVALTIAQMIPAPDWIEAHPQAARRARGRRRRDRAGASAAARRLGRVLLPLLARHAALRGADNVDDLAGDNAAYRALVLEGVRETYGTVSGSRVMGGEEWNLAEDLLTFQGRSAGSAFTANA